MWSCGSTSALVAAVTLGWPIGSVQAQGPCFTSTGELWLAVQQYVTQGNASFEFLEPSYGWPIGSWCVRDVTNFTGIFQGRETFNEPLDGWDVSAATTMAYMFDDALSFDQPLNSWQVSRVTDFTAMFQRAKSFNNNIQNWDVSNAVTMERMFQGANFFDQSLNNWQVGRVTNFDSMFNMATSFNSLIDNWNTGSAESMVQMFQNAVLFDQPLGRWNVSKGKCVVRASGFIVSVCLWVNLPE